MASSPDTGKLACSSTLGSASSSSGNTGESITNPSSPARTTVHVVCHMRLTKTIASEPSASALMAPQAQLTPSSFAASRSDATSASGFFWPLSSSALLRLTQITGIFFFRHGSTS